MGTDKSKITSLRDMPRDIAPPRDLWQGIEARLGGEAQPHGAEPVRADFERPRRYGRTAGLQYLAAAAVIAALAVGIWIGRAVLPGPGAGSAPTSRTVQNQAQYVMDTRYVHDRAQLVKGLEARLATLPPDSRAKVVASLKAISDSKKELEAALGKDPSNALLQELLVNTYQDEMRVLTAVQEAGKPGEGI